MTGPKWDICLGQSPVRSPQISIKLCHAFIRVYQNGSVLVVSFFTLQAASFMCYERP